MFGSSLPGAAMRSRSCGAMANRGADSQMAPSYGGLISHGACGLPKANRKVGPLGKMDKVDYAMALQEQIATRKASLSVDGPRKLDGLSETRNPFVDKSLLPDVEHEKHLKTQEAYAQQLREQIAERNVYRNAKQARDDRPPAMPKVGMQATDEISGYQCSGKRCAGPLQMPSKDDYASALREQMAAREVKRHVERRSSRPPSPAPEDMPVERSGRRHGGPINVDKEAYANELIEQMASRDAARAAESALSAPIKYPSFDPSLAANPLAMGRSESVPAKSGRKGAPSYDAKGSYNDFLQQQMEDAKALKAANAFHLQREASPHRTGSGSAMTYDAPGKGKRLPGPAQAPCKTSYALELQQQIAERDAQRNALNNVDVVPSALSRGVANDASTQSRGRRHGASPVSQQTYAQILQEQMAEKIQEKVNSRHHLQDQNAPSSSSMPAGDDAFRGKRHNEKAYGSELQSASRGASLGQIGAPVQEASRPSQPSRMASMGAAVMGCAQPSASDESGFDADEHEREMIARLLAQRENARASRESAASGPQAGGYNNPLNSSLNSSGARRIRFADETEDEQFQRRDIVDSRAAEAQRLLDM